MAEFITYTPEHETTEERFSWDEILRALADLSEYDPELDVYEAIEDLKDEDLEDGRLMVFNYAVRVLASDEDPDDLERVMELLMKNGMVEGWSSDDEV